MKSPENYVKKTILQKRVIVAPCKIKMEEVLRKRKITYFIQKKVVQMCVGMV